MDHPSDLSGPGEDPQQPSVGRPTKLTEERMMRFLDAVEAGHFRETAARLAGFSPATLYRWLAADEEPYLTFQRVVEETEARVEAKVLGVIMDRIPDDPRLAMDFLGRRFRARWSSSAATVKPAEVAPTPTKAPTSVNVVVLERAELEAAVQQRLDEHRQLSGGSSLTDEILANHRESGNEAGEDEGPTGQEDVEA